MLEDAKAARAAAAEEAKAAEETKSSGETKEGDAPASEEEDQDEPLPAQMPFFVMGESSKWGCALDCQVLGGFQ